MPDRCQSAYLDSVDESQEPEFLVCLANPGYVPADEGTTDSATTGETTGGAIGGTTGGTTGGGTTGCFTETPPTIEEAYEGDCMNLSAEYSWTKKVVEKKKTQYVSKVKVCHKTGNGSSHTIVISCKALKSHIHHHDDTIGVCNL